MQNITETQKGIITKGIPGLICASRHILTSYSDRKLGSCKGHGVKPSSTGQCNESRCKKVERKGRAGIQELHKSTQMLHFWTASAAAAGARLPTGGVTDPSARLHWAQNPFTKVRHFHLITVHSCLETWLSITKPIYIIKLPKNSDCLNKWLGNAYLPQQFPAAQVCLCSHSHPCHILWTSTSACVPVFLVKQDSRQLRIPENQWYYPVETEKQQLNDT